MPCQGCGESVGLTVPKPVGASPDGEILLGRSVKSIIIQARSLIKEGEPVPAETYAEHMRLILAQMGVEL